MGKRVKILRETMKAAEDGCYFVDEKEVKLPISFEQIKEVKLYTPEQVAKLPARDMSGSEPSRITLRNQDTLEAAFELHQHRKENEKPVLILNFANPHRPGGGIRSRPGTQEEHLCVKTTVLCSLETEEAWPFYQTNLDCGTQAQTDTILFSPNTMVIRNPDLSLREDPFPVAVMTVSAPIASRMEESEFPNLENILKGRIRGMLRAAAAEGYTHLVLGAWGCGNFGNNPELVAKLFHEALQGSFEEVTMAVFDNSEYQYRYSCFEKHFGKPEKE